MGKILLILVVVFIAIFLISLFNGEKTGDATSNGLDAAFGCGAQIFHLALAAFFLWLGFLFLSWVFG